MVSKWLVYWLALSVGGALCGWFVLATLLQIPILDLDNSTLGRQFFQFVAALLGAVIGMLAGQSLALAKTRFPSQIYLGEAGIGIVVGLVVALLAAIPLTFIFAFALGSVVDVSNADSGTGGLLLLALGFAVAIGVGWFILGASVSWRQAAFLRTVADKRMRVLVLSGTWIVATLVGAAALYAVAWLLSVSFESRILYPLVWSVFVLFFALLHSTVIGHILDNALGPIAIPVADILKWRPNQLARILGALAVAGGIAFLIWQTGLTPCGWIDIPLQRSGCLRSWSTPDTLLRNIIFSRDGTTVLSSLWEPSIGEWSVKEGTLLGTFQARDYAFSEIVLSHDGTLLAAGLYDGGVQLWQMNTRQTVRIIETKNKVTSVAFSPDDTVLAVLHDYDNHIQLYQRSDGSLLKTSDEIGRDINSFVFSPDGKQLIVGTSGASLQVWDIATNKLLQVAGHDNSIYEISYSADGTQRALSEGYDSGPRLEQLQTNQMQRLAARDLSGSGFVFSSDGAWLLTPTTNGQVALWRTQDASLLRRYGYNDNYNSAAFCPCGNRLAFSQRDGRIEIWDLRP